MYLPSVRSLKGRFVAEFDRHAQGYREMHDQSIRITGETGGYFADYKLNVLRRLWKVQPGARIVDFGCGIGQLTTRLADAWPGCSVVGFDPSQASLDEAAQKTAFHPNVSLTNNLETIQEPADWSVVANVFHHIEPPHRQEAISQLARVTRAGGRLVIFEHNPYNPLTRHAVAICPFDEGVVLLRRAELERLLIASGFKIEKKEYIVFFPAFLAGLRGLEPSLGWLPAGAQYYIQAISPGPDQSFGPGS